MTSRTNGEGKTTQYGYDLANRPTTVTNPLEETQQMKYNIQGNMSEYTNPDGTSIRYEYDKLNGNQEIHAIGIEQYWNNHCK